MIMGVEKMMVQEVQSFGCEKGSRGGDTLHEMAARLDENERFR